MMSDSGGLAGLFWTMAGIWGLVALIYYVWFLWSLSRLFPKIGLPESHGWIPVWNHWQLLARGGYPGWIVLLVLVPVLGAIAVVIFTILALQRINTEYGKGAGFTVLGILIAPVWAMALAQHIDALGPRVITVDPAPYRPPGYDAAAGTPAPVEAAAMPSALPDPEPAPRPEELPPVPSAALADEREDAVAQNDWGFSNTTIDAYERLASEPVDRPRSAMIEDSPPPYTWPEQLNTPPAGEPVFDPDDDSTVIVPVRRRFALETAEGEVLELVADVVVIGRKPESNDETLKLPDPTRTVSKTHARLRRDGDDWTVEDLNSTNGVALFNDQGEPKRIEPGIPTPVSGRMLVGTLEITLRGL